MNIQEFEYKAGVAAQLLKALASRPRLMVLCHLADGEKSVGEIAGLTGLRMSAVSQNLAVLRAEQLVAQRRDGTTIHYRLADPTARKVIEVLYRAFCSDRKAEMPRRKSRANVSAKPHPARNRPRRALGALSAPDRSS